MPVGPLGISSTVKILFGILKFVIFLDKNLRSSTLLISFMPFFKIMAAPISSLKLWCGIAKATADSTLELTIGASAKNIAIRNFEGHIKDVRIYNDIKSADWIKNEYQKCVPDDS